MPSNIVTMRLAAASVMTCGRTMICRAGNITVITTSDGYFELSGGQLTASPRGDRQVTRETPVVSLGQGEYRKDIYADDLGGSE